MKGIPATSKDFKKKNSNELKGFHRNSKEFKGIQRNSKGIWRNSKKFIRIQSYLEEFKGIQKISRNQTFWKLINWDTEEIH